MANRERGDAVIAIDGSDHRLRFTLGALADIERRLGASDPNALGARLTRLSAADLQAVLAALLAAGGATDPAALAARADPRAAARATAACIKANLE